jgi:hypothetical protein
MRRITVAALLLLLPLSASFTEVPVRTEQLIWSMLSFNGRDYSPAFATEDSDTIYLLAGVDNFLSLRETLVYWWPISSEWKTDTDTLNVQFPGSLELRDSHGAVRRLELESYTYFNIRGDYEVNWKVVTGTAAEQELAKYASLYNSYFKAVQDYQVRNGAYTTELQSLAARIQKLKDERRDYAALLQRLNTLPAPVAPVAPGYYVVPPASMQKAFILNLPTGRYSLRFINPDGSVAQGSEKTVVVHSRRRTGGVGFEVIPSDKWTRPEASVTPSSTLYVNGSADLYLRPFLEDEFNDLSYARTVNNAARGNANIARWVRIQQVPRATIRMDSPGNGITILKESPFLVRQSQGNSLGYTITAWVPNGPDKDTQPNLVAFRVPMNGGAKAIRIRAADQNAAFLAGGEREIRVVGPLPRTGLLVILALSPLLVLALVLTLRARTYAGKSLQGD